MTFGEGGSQLLGSVVFDPVLTNKKKPKRSKNIKNWVVVEGSKHQPLKDWMLPASFEVFFVSLQTKSCYYEKDTNKKTWLFKGAKAQSRHETSEDNELNR